MRIERTQNNLYFKSIKGNDSPGKLYKPFPNRKLYKPNFLKAWMNYSFVKIELNSIWEKIVNRPKESKIFAIRKNPQFLQNSYNAQIKYTCVSWDFSLSEDQISKCKSFWHPHCQPLPHAHQESCVMKSINLVADLTTYVTWNKTFNLSKA